MNEFEKPSPLRGMIRRSVGINEDDYGRPIQPPVVKAQAPAPAVSQGMQRGLTTGQLAEIVATAVAEALRPTVEKFSRAVDQRLAQPAQVQRAAYAPAPQPTSAVEIFGGGYILPMPESGYALTQRAAYENAYTMNVRASTPAGRANQVINESRQGPAPSIRLGQQRPAGMASIREVVERSLGMRY